MNPAEKTILFIAYSINPYHNTENNLNWKSILEIARHYRLVIFTQGSNRKDIENYGQEHPETAYLFQKISFEYFDFPEWLSFCKKVGLASLIYFYFWQIAFPFILRKRKIWFDMAHCYQSAGAFIPAFLWLCGKPFLWNQVMDYPAIPVRFLSRYGLGFILANRLNLGISKLYRYINLYVKLPVFKSGKFLIVSEKTTAFSEKSATRSFDSSVVTERLEETGLHAKEKFIVLSAGRFSAINGFDITINAFAEFYKRLPLAEQHNTELILAGSGPAQKQLEKLIRKNNLGNVAKIINRTDKNNLADLYGSASVFLSPSFTKTGSRASEALRYGLPVLCFDNSTLAGLVPDYTELKVSYSDYKTCIQEFAWDLNTLYSIPAYYEAEVLMALEKYNEQLSSGNQLNNYLHFYQQIVAAYGSVPAFA